MGYQKISLIHYSVPENTKLRIKFWWRNSVNLRDTSGSIPSCFYANKLKRHGEICTVGEGAPTPKEASSLYWQTVSQKVYENGGGYLASANDDLCQGVCLWVLGGICLWVEGVHTHTHTHTHTHIQTRTPFWTPPGLTSPGHQPPAHTPDTHIHTPLDTHPRQKHPLDTTPSHG